MNPLSGIDLASAMPFALLVLFGIVCLLLEVFQRPSQSRQYISRVAAAGFGVTALTAFSLMGLPGTTVFAGSAAFDGFSQVMTMVFCLGGAMASLTAPRYLDEQGIDRGEFYALLLLAVSGMVMMVSAVDLMVLFVGLEIQSIAVYGLTGYLRRSPASAEAGLKYFLLGATASAMMLYGIALLYGATGSTNLVAIGEALGGGSDAGASSASQAIMNGIVGMAQGIDPANNAYWNHANGSLPIAAAGLILLAVAFLTKVAAAPFHMWAPDAYCGAPTPASGFMAATVKAAGFAAFVRVLALALFSEEARMGDYGWVQIVMWVAGISMVVGNLTALVQTNVRRMLAFSSVAHAGYLLMGVTALGYGAGNANATSGMVFYLFAYTLATLGSFGVIAWFGRRDEEAESFDDFNGIGYTHPWAAAALTVFLFSAAGFPGTAGFIGKFMLFSDAIGAAGTAEHSGGLVFLAVVGLVSSVIGAAYYFRLVLHMYTRKARREIVGLNDSVARIVIVAAAVLTLWCGLVPATWSGLAQTAAQQLLGRADGGYESPVQSVAP